MRLLVAVRTVKRPIGILHDVLIKVESFIFPADFVILDCEVDFEVPIILGRPFLAIGRALVDMEKGQMKFWLNNEEATFNICRTMRQSGELQSVSAISQKEQMKKENEKNCKTRVYGWGFSAFRQFWVALSSRQAPVQMDWPLHDYPSIPSWSI